MAIFFRYLAVLLLTFDQTSTMAFTTFTSHQGLSLASNDELDSGYASDIDSNSSWEDDLKTDGLKAAVDEKVVSIQWVFEHLQDGNIKFKDLPDVFINYQSAEEGDATPLMWLIANAHRHNAYFHMLQVWLKDPRTNVDLQDEDGVTAFMYTLCSEFSDSKELIPIIDLLLSRKPNLDLQDHKGWTALMYAVANTTTDKQFELYFQAIPRLLQGKPDLTKINANGENAFDMAKTQGIKMLLLETLQQQNPMLAQMMASLK